MPLVPFLMSMATSPLFMLAGTALQAAGAAGQARTRKTEAEYKRDIARVNVAIGKQNIEQSRKAELVDVDLLSRTIRSAVGTTSAAAAASGLDVSATGETGAQLIADVKRAGAFKTLQLKHKFELDRRSMRQQIVKASAEGDLLDLQSKSISPALAGLSTGMSSLSSGLLTMQQLERYG